jgi:hypothetical protein
MPSGKFKKGLLIGASVFALIVAASLMIAR